MKFERETNIRLARFSTMCEKYVEIISAEKSAKKGKVSMNSVQSYHCSWTYVGCRISNLTMVVHLNLLFSIKSGSRGWLVGGLGKGP